MKYIIFMRNIFNLSAIACFTALTGCATSQYFNKMTMEQAMEFENKTRAEIKKNNTHAKISTSYAQPANKTEPCLVPMNEKYMDAPNFKSYWDGRCKSGYAYGLGRYIATSDILTIEEITIYAEGAKPYEGRKTVSIDYEGKSWKQGVHFVQPYSELSGRRNIATDNSVIQAKGYFQESGENTVFYALNGQKYHFFRMLTVDGQVGYQMENTGALPNHPVEYVIKTVGIGTEAPFQVVSYKTGQFLAVTGSGAGAVYQEVPQEYKDYIKRKVSTGLQLITRIDQAISGANEMEERYLQNVCVERPNIPSGIPEQVFMRICTFKKELAAKTEETLKKANAEQEAVNIRFAQQREQAAQQAQRDRATDLSGLQSAMDSLVHSSTQWQQGGAAAAQQASQFRAPQVQPFGIPSSNLRYCQQMGNITSCR